MTQQAYAYGPPPGWYAPPPPSQEWYPVPPPSKPWWKRRWIWVTSISAALVVAGGVWGCIAYNTHQQELRVAHQQQVAAQQAEQQRQAAERAAEQQRQAEEAAAAQQRADADAVKVDMQRTLDSDPDMAPYHFVFTEVHLVRAGDNHYDGIATVHDFRGIDHSVIVHVTRDNTGIMWHTDQGAFAWAMYE